MLIDLIKMRYRVLIASLCFFSSSECFLTENPNVTLIPSTSTQIVTESKTDLVGNSPVTSPVPMTTSANFNLNTTTEISESRPQYPPLHRILTPIEEKIQALACDVPVLPTEYRIWKGNETHELLLPITVPTDCSQTSVGSKKLGQGNSTEPSVLNTTETSNCPHSTTLSWDGSIEIQSGDVLLVRIDDSHLIQYNTIMNQGNDTDHSLSRLMHEPTTAVYQVTRTGHDHCDVTEGILLDITPLKVDNQKVVTLYDKDLTLGINLLIVVSELWGNQCIRLKVTVKSDNCGENEDCSGKGICYSNDSMDGYECQCCLGFVGQHCEEQDACYPSRCKNNGICVDISQGHEGSTFQCLCPYGYTGKTCEDQTNACLSMPCQNGATCIGNVTQFKCECLMGFSGPLCQHSHNDCESSPCVHGICVNQEEGYKCFCQPGFTGTHCEYEYNECQSSPCTNGGTCTDHVGHYTCSCGRGFTGRRCHIKVDLCQPNPCPEPRYCVDHGNNYSCECPKGYSGRDCLIPSRAACSTNPCTNGGTCWSNMDSFYCACKPGYTGKTCEDEFVVETITNVDTINKENELDLQMPISIHLDHLHNVYIAAGTLVCAFVIVALIVTVCHCRVNKTYKRFISRANPLWGCRKRVSQPSATTNSEWFSGKDKAATATPSRSLPSLDATDMYYTLDFSESQCSPLIQ
ncbi:delta and Notch-like epidermal growth factor-related receptor [Tribolium madens]|uniref:delta and Notch-like epidermal growth factor-related receptor n=1 Tax=Tribolium madens TaxID=41895 RepID=UPI001CF765D1|nr:delta and Notch-like epidermal growth factor-related receptor [Tribolium madens]